MKNIMKRLFNLRFCQLKALGLFLSILPLTIWLLSYLNIANLSILRSFDFGQISLFSMSTLHSDGISFAMMILFLLGTIMYIATQGRERRLFRFSLSMLALSQVLKIISLIVFYVFAYLFNKDIHWTLTSSVSTIFQFLIGCLAPLVYLVVSYAMLRSANKTVELDTETDNDVSTFRLAEINDRVYVEASNWLRLTNLIVDTLVNIIVVLAVLVIITRALNFDFEKSPIIYYASLILIRFLFLSIFEWLLGATPGKLLTETRVVNLYSEQVDKISFRTAILRTLSRFFPFEPLIFLFNRRLHDEWSDTTVVREARTGAKGRVYLYVILSIALSIAVGWYVHNEYEKHKQNAINKQEQMEKQTDLMMRIGSVTRGSYLKFSVGRYSSDHLYFVVKEASGGQITALEVGSSSQRVVEVDELVQEMGGVAGLDYDYGAYHIVLPIDKLIRTLAVDYGEYGSDNSYIKDNERELYLKDVFVSQEPRHTEYSSFGSSYGRSGDKLSEFNLSFPNEGWDMNEVFIKILEGNATSLDVTGGTRTSFSGRYSGREPDFSAIIIHRCPDGRLINYILKVNPGTRSLTLMR